MAVKAFKVIKSPTLMLDVFESPDAGQAPVKSNAGNRKRPDPWKDTGSYCERL